MWSAVAVVLLTTGFILYKKSKTVNELISGPKQYLLSGAYIQGDSVYSAKGTLIGTGIKQANSQGIVYFNNGEILYANGDLFSADDDLIRNVKAS